MNVRNNADGESVKQALAEQLLSMRRRVEEQINGLEATGDKDKAKEWQKKLTDAKAAAKRRAK